jgi:hypothetical protein
MVKKVLLLLFYFAVNQCILVCILICVLLVHVCV